MPKLNPVTPQTHGTKFWRRFTSYAFAADTAVAPLVAAELPRALAAMPVGFVKQDTRCFPAGLLSLEPGHNLFVTPEGRWAGPYVPACFRGYPFGLARLSGKPDPVLCVDQDSKLVNDTDGERFFDDAGRLSEAVAGVVGFLKKIEQNRVLTAAAVDALDRAGVLVPWQITDAADNPVSGLFRIDTAALDALDDAAFLALRTAGALPLVYAHLFSLDHVPRLKKLAQHRKSTPPPSEPADIQDLFTDDDTIIG
jgi:hypothetical protein